MYQSNYGDLEMKVRLEDIDLQLVMGGHSRKRVRQRIGCDANEVFFRIALLLETPSVSKHINETLAIGQDCVIFDADTGYSYCIAMGMDEIFVKTVYYSKAKADMQRVGDSNFCMFVEKAEVLVADIFSNVKLELENLAECSSVWRHANC